MKLQDTSVTHRTIARRHAPQGEGTSLSPEGFEAFYRDTVGVVYSYLFNRCGQRHETAEDLTQVTYLAAARAIADGRVVTHPRAWIIGVARHKVVDHIRRERRRNQARWGLFDGSAVAGQSDPAEHLPLRDGALQALDSLPAMQRAAVVLRYFDDLPVRDVATALGKSLRATESLIARGRSRFRRVYEEHDDD